MISFAAKKDDLGYPKDSLSNVTGEDAYVNKGIP